MTLLEASQDPALPDRVIEAMRHRPLARIVAAALGRRAAGPAAGPPPGRPSSSTGQLARLERGRGARSTCSARGLESANKFIAYDLFPEARYTVVVSEDRKRTKVSVGSNPWPRVPRTHDIAAALPALRRRRPPGGGRRDACRRDRPTRPGASRAEIAAALGAEGSDMTPGQYILVVDDDDDFREALCEVLAQAGYPVEQAGQRRGRRWSRLEGEVPGIVLLDLKMPGIDGWGVIERMRAEPRWAAIPVLILSAYGYEWEAELLGVQGYIPKADVKMDGILARVKTAAGDPPLRH